ncbi:dTDP-4-dehydrorhamnose reductase [Paenibacillus sp. YYML68]|uniref:dTDP-4-dehydrorhamnose reductase n=1 Tax=Paenibacillus sp. YYML68 TaxID=2909250 RepID=UPI002492B440|nr:dTDP-4-dehydrorhamnose reductase [Paenibacillus sp. YYML68]
MKLLITGAGGQLGRDLTRVLSEQHEVVPMTRQQLDIVDEKVVREALADVRPDAVIHAAAYTKVDLAETETAEAYRINTLGTGYVALAADAVKAKVVYVSTDYVFDGSKGAPYSEDDPVRPLSVYGVTKRLGEQLVETTCARHYIVRTSWLYGQGGDNFVTKVLSKAQAGQPLQVVDDQFGSPTYTRDLAECIGRLVETEHYGLYHVSNGGYCSRFAFAEAIVQEAGLAHVELRPVTSDQFVTPAHRPAHSAFAHEALRKAGFPPMRGWREALAAYIQDDVQIMNSKGEQE